MARKIPKTKHSETGPHLCDILKDVYLPQGQGQVALMLLHLLYEQGRERRYYAQIGVDVLSPQEKKICNKIEEFMKDDYTRDAVEHIMLLMRETKE